MRRVSPGFGFGRSKGGPPDKGCGVRQSVLLFGRHCAHKSLAGSHRRKLFPGDLPSNRRRGVVVWRELDDDRRILREASSQSWILGDFEFVVEVSENGPIRLVYEDEMAAQILIFVVMVVGRTDGGRGAVDLSVEVVRDVLSIPFLCESSDVLSEDVVERFEILRSRRIAREWNRYRKLWV